MALPWSKFFWSDYASDPALKLCSLAAQGLWMRMLCIAAEHDPVGYVAINGEGLDHAGIASLCGVQIDQVEECLSELKRRGVYSTDRRGWIYSRRLVNDAKKSRKASEAGKKGGNPSLRKESGNSAPLKGRDKGQDKRDPKPQKPEARYQKKKDHVEKRPHPIPDDWVPEAFGEETEARRIEDGWNGDALNGQLEAFRDHHRSHGSKFVDWQAAWGTWVRNSAKFARRDAARPQARPASNDPHDSRSLVKQVLEEKGIAR